MSAPETPPTKDSIENAHARIDALAALVSKAVENPPTAKDHGARMHTYAQWVAIALVAFSCPELVGKLLALIGGSPAAAVAPLMHAGPISTPLSPAPGVAHGLQLTDPETGKLIGTCTLDSNGKLACKPYP